MWRDALREDGASGSVDTGPARLGLLIALIPTSLGLPLRPTSLVPSSAAHCVTVDGVAPRLGHFGESWKHCPNSSMPS